MAQVLHGSARTTATVRRAVQASQASIRSLAQQYGLNPKTVAKWKQRSAVQDAPMGPKQAHSTVLSTEEEALIDRIDVDGSNQVPINLRLDPNVIRALPSLQSDSSRLPESPQSDDSQPELSVNSTESARVLIGRQV